MAVDDDHTLVGEQPWQDLGETVRPPVSTTADVQLNLLDPATNRAIRALCWAACVAIWCGIAILMIVLAGLVVGIFGNPPVP